MTPHTCEADGCTAVTMPDHLMCRPHWHLVPPALKKQIETARRVGHLRAYASAKSEAITAVKLAEEKQRSLEVFRQGL